MSSVKKIAVFGDTHGHLRLMFQLCRLWQCNHGVHLSGVLQCGDLGFFPDPEALDRATRRFARKDPEELGFARFFRRPEPLERDVLLEQTLLGSKDDLNTVRCPVIWCHGNHEDFQELERLTGKTAVTPVDVYERLCLLRSGCVTEVAGVRVGALGGGQEPDGVDDQDYGLEEPWKWVSARGCDRIRGQSFDVLLTHVGPRGIGGERNALGSRRIREVVAQCRPRYHFFAHHSRPVPPVQIGHTQCFWLNDVHFERHKGRYQQLHDRCMGILSWNDASEQVFAYVGEPWLRTLTWNNPNA